MEIYAETAMSILDELHTERLAYHSEYLPLAYAINRLESYEDTGLSPEEIERILDSYGRGMTLRTENAQRLEIIKEIPINRLRELAQAEKEGRLVVLPCKVGDTVYIIHNRAIRKTTVESIHQWSSGHWKLSVHTDKKYIHWTGYEVHFESFGKTVFLTREAAEAALEEKECTK
jgi:hypothetical protein